MKKTLKKDKKVQIFVSYFDEKRQTISTAVLENQNGTLKEIATLSYFAKELGCGQNKQIWLQKPFVSGAYPGNARLIAYTDGKFAPAKETLSTYRNWLTGLNRYAVESADVQNVIYTSSNGPLRLVTASGKRAESRSRPQTVLFFYAGAIDSIQEPAYHERMNSCSYVQWRTL